MSYLKPRSVESTRDKLLTVAEKAILEKGFAATSIEEIIAEVGISKGGFFYHFKDKSEMLTAILSRTLASEQDWFAGLFARAHAQCDDPLDEFLTFLDLLCADMERLPEVHPGCLVAACCFQERLFTPEVHDIACDSLLSWRHRFHARFKDIARLHPPQIDVDLMALADMLTAQVDGAIILSRTVREKEVLARQTRLYRQFVEAVFRGTTAQHDRPGNCNGAAKAAPHQIIQQ